MQLVQTDQELIERIRAGDERTFDQLFLTWFKSLHAYANTFTRDADEAEEIVQQVFCRLWEKRQQLDPDGYIRSFLYRSVHNQCLNYLKHHKVRAAFGNYAASRPELTESDLSKEIQANELERRLHRAISELPAQCGLIFKMSRLEQLKYQQIADQLQISIKTVENQMGKALKVLRLKLADFLPAFLLYLVKYL